MFASESSLALQSANPLGVALSCDGMCGRYTNAVGLEEFSETFGIDPGRHLPKPTWSIRPTDQVLAVIAPDGNPEPRMLRWGLVPRSAKTLKGSPKINAKLETAHSLYDFRYLLARSSHRALQIADGYYEWLKPEHRHAAPQPFHFTVDNGKPFAFAALWTTNDQLAEQPIHSITLLTCDPAANRVAASIHNRMPVILADPEARQTWLDSSISTEEALAVCGALPQERLTAKAANKLLNTAGPNDDSPQLLTAPPTDQTEHQLKLA